MSRTRKDMPYRLGGHRHRYSCIDSGHGEWAREMRRHARADFKRSLQRALQGNGEPYRRSRWHYEYYD